MSAIVGIYHFNEEPLNPLQTSNLMKVFQQYPADDVHTWNKSNIFLGCHAQWITPESIGEPLPYYDYEKKIAITADAIIDNRDELFDRLQVEQTQRKTIPDSQLILLAYYKWGEEVPKHLIGDFAFMIWDEKKRKLFGARDFSGARTLYFYHDQSRFAFSTTIEPLFTLPYIEKKMNEEWLAEFLAIPGMVEAVDTQSTVYKTIHQIPPSHSITVADSKVNLTRYSTIEVEDTIKLNSNEEYEEAFKEVFNEAVTSRIRTHGKVGSHLSGGLDSGTVVSLAAKALQKENKQLHTFSYVPEESFMDWTPKYYIPDERPYIKETVNHVGNINDHYLSFEGKSPLTDVDDFLDLMEMPYKFFENIFWLNGISEEAHNQGIKILLNGARGNHSISWGSWNLSMDYYSSLFKKVKWISLNHELNQYCINHKTGKSVMLPIVAKRAFPLIARIFTNNHQNDYQFPSFINPAFAQKTNVFNKLQEYGVNASGMLGKNLTEHRKNHYNQLFVWNKSGIANTKFSLRYSLWDRDPTNDLRVIRFCLALPEEQYVQGGMERSFIRRATKGILPDKVRLNQHIRGVQGADTIHRMSSNWQPFMDEINQLCKDPITSELFDINVLKNSVEKIGHEPRPEFVWADEFKVLTRSLIVYRFIKNLN
ncbi:asparagine synthetase B [Neobacillus sp. MM2021_6]|uniref:asparagine synthase-related protein n=1 Tax=Bacillaceae TaxID=186817 RepID=UPI001407D29E|nr:MULTISPECIES: asparagine synthase-related protein [Bacillaceae]MBO0962185.1 asparagine synthetase B [Neobacillus sp. MM2021_6]NHC19035.1 asparagine synthetase B [Bacillus sp. MM2020_4]